MERLLGPGGPGPRSGGAKLDSCCGGGAPADLGGVAGVELFDARLARGPVVLPGEAGRGEDSYLAAVGEAVRGEVVGVVLAGVPSAARVSVNSM